MVRLVPIENDVILMVLLLNMLPLRGVKMLLPIEIDESCTQLADLLLLFHSWCLLLEIQCFNFIYWVPRFRKANVNYRDCCDLSIEV